MLNGVDDYSREYLALTSDTSLSGARYARELTSPIGMRGKPSMIVSNNGTELDLVSYPALVA